MANKYSDKEIIAAINIVHQILDIEDFSLEVSEYDSNIPDTQELRFNLVDRQSGNLGGIEEAFDNLASVIDRMDIYHTDSLYRAFEERQERGEVIPPDDYDRKLLMFLESDYCTDLLSTITASMYTDYVHTSYGKYFNSNTDRLKENEGIDELSYLLDKDIAQKIMNTQSAYVMVEYKGHIYISAYDTFENVNEFISAIKKCELPNGEFDNRYDMTIYDDYNELIEDEYGQVCEDIEDIGLTENSKWNFYLTRNEMIYIGIDEKDIDAELKSNENELSIEDDFDYGY